ncbi:hypothetical protein [Microscilla marina]|uniref:Uncharacterized protein n=1 Tax=Microscilla marina ATCC 23134 TaxID=313606 RepID=A1ZF66_MICM2|nr:hypothetical protein [Microscilla marina]EAY31168.1 hypothetical protein M23134_07578 [Microscilla marina ATCC 23134]
MQNIVQENQIYRFQILMELYKTSNSDMDFIANIQELASNVGISNMAFQAAYKYLYMHELIRMHPSMATSGTGSQTQYQASITHQGMKVVEEVFKYQHKATEYFPPYREMMR